MSRLTKLLGLVLLGAYVVYASTFVMEHWRFQYQLAHVDLTFKPYTVTKCSAIWIGNSIGEAGIDVSCDGQVTVRGPRDAAAQAFWDRVIELTPRQYFEPRVYQPLVIHDESKWK